MIYRIETADHVSPPNTHSSASAGSNSTSYLPPNFNSNPPIVANRTPVQSVKFSMTLGDDDNDNF